MGVHSIYAAIQVSLDFPGICRLIGINSIGRMTPLMALFPPRKGGGEGVARGGKGQGALIHSLTVGDGLSLAHRISPANGEERA